MNLKKVLIVSGGSGSSFLYKSLNKKNNLIINFLINLYDDGKSTGKLRSYFDYHILGPSDLRKLQALSFNTSNQSNKNINFFKSRINSKIFNTKKNIIDKNLSNKINKRLNIKFLPKEIQTYIKKALNLFFYSKKKLDYKDISLANLVYAYLANKYSSYNIVESKIRKIFKIKNKVFFNDCNNLFLFAISKNGKIIKNEEMIVNYNNLVKLKDIYFCKKFLSENEINRIDSYKTIKLKTSYLNKKYSILPQIDQRTKKEIKNTDFMLFAPGTQFSSLFPTYLTKNFVSNIRKKTIKILILNLQNDLDTKGFKISDYLEKINYYLSSKKNHIKYYNFFNYILINKSKNKNSIKLDIPIPKNSKCKFIIENFENNPNNNLHNIKKTKNIILKIIDDET